MDTTLYFCIAAGLVLASVASFFLSFIFLRPQKPSNIEIVEQYDAPGKPLSQVCTR